MHKKREHICQYENGRGSSLTISRGDSDGVLRGLRCKRDSGVAPHHGSFDLSKCRWLLFFIIILLARSTMCLVEINSCAFQCFVLIFASTVDEYLQYIAFAASITPSGSIACVLKSRSKLTLSYASPKGTAIKSSS